MLNQKFLGINGLGRIGKLVLWNQLITKHFDGVIVSLGRSVGTDIEDLIDFILNDSTYGALDRFMYGYSGKGLEVKILNRENYEISIDGMYIKFLTIDRNPQNIKWKENHVEIVVDCTGVFLDPKVSSSATKGSIRGHLEAGAKKVVISAPFKIKGQELIMPEDSTMIVYGINHSTYDDSKHHIVSAASCTTTALSHMMKPLLDNIETSRILTASMSTIHAATNNQNILDAIPGENASDLRKNRSAFNNIILTSTGAAKALEFVLPEIKSIGFMADSVRIPTNTVSLVTLNLTFRSKLKSSGEPKLTSEFINGLYREAAENTQDNLLYYSEKQTVSSDVRGFKASAVIEGCETSTKTGFLTVSKEFLYDMGIEGNIQLPVTHAKIFGWYDNEFGSYVNSLCKLIIHMDKELNQ